LIEAADSEGFELGEISLKDAGFGEGRAGGEVAGGTIGDFEGVDNGPKVVRGTIEDVLYRANGEVVVGAVRDFEGVDDGPKVRNVVGEKLEPIVAAGSHSLFVEGVVEDVLNPRSSCFLSLAHSGLQVNEQLEIKSITSSLL